MYNNPSTPPKSRNAPKSVRFFTKPSKLLHIAPELCFIDRFEALNHIDYITADLESPLAKVKMDIHEIPFEDNTFDLSFCNHVMEHVDDDIKVSMVNKAKKEAIYVL